MLRCRQEQPVPAALPLLFPPHPALSSFAERREQMPGAPGAVLGTELGVTTLLGGIYPAVGQGARTATSCLQQTRGGQ